MKLELAQDERDLLIRILDSAYRDMRVEVRRTDTSTWHDELKCEEERMMALLDRLRNLVEN